MSSEVKDLKKQLEITKLQFEIKSLELELATFKDSTPRKGPNLRREDYRETIPQKASPAWGVTPITRHPETTRNHAMQYSRINTMPSITDGERPCPIAATPTACAPTTQEDPSFINQPLLTTAYTTMAAALRETVTTPRPEIARFNDDPKQYFKFIRSFITNIEKRIDDDDLKLSYLIQYCDGEAKEAIEDCVIIKTNGYNRAKDILAHRYGRPHTIA